MPSTKRRAERAVVKRNYTQRYHGELPYSMTPYEARALCFWAAIGIAKSNAGSYPDTGQKEGDEGIVKSWARDLKMNLPVQPRFNEYRNQARLALSRRGRKK